MLDILGLDRTTESVYREMLAAPGAGARTLCARLGLAESELRGALDRLSELGLLRTSPEDRQVDPVRPELGLGLLLARQQAELATQQQRVEASRIAVAELISEAPPAAPSLGDRTVLHLNGAGDIRDYAMAVCEETEEELRVFAPTAGRAAPEPVELRPLHRRLLARGVASRTVYMDSVRLDPAGVAHAEWLTSLGAGVRTAPSLPTRMIICDRRVALVVRCDDGSGPGAVAIASAEVVEALGALFETVWDSAAPWGAPPRPSPSDLSRQQAEALRLLAQGHTDEAIAKRLGVSTRTARRIASAVMTHLDARSRFQAGVHAVQRGCLPRTDVPP
ncbi:helix-turn-helix domain-containing protein [Streptomyces sp. NPDC001407]|uniref:helix-turn-helix transcriptional regulator n=1 Tax=unclassified Streptomyces TaxID=2593676 RepID=UPI00340451E9